MHMLLLSATDNIFQMGEEPAEPKMYIVASRAKHYQKNMGSLDVNGHWIKMVRVVINDPKNQPAG